MSVKDRIEKSLTEALKPQSLQVVDESHLHAGHAGARPEGETHFRVYIVSAAFESKGRIDRHRTVHKILADELAGPVHALAIHASAPGEPAREPG
jgi:BolA protein